MTDLAWSFAPWIAFLLGVRVENVYWGAAVGGVAGAIVLARAARNQKAHLFDVIGPVYFGGMLILLGALRPDDIDTWGRYAQAVAHGSLTVIVFGSILLNRPFTEPYARERVPQAYWGAPEFRAANRKISLMFGIAFLVGTASLITAGATDGPQLLLRIVVPFGALFLALLYAQRQSGSATGEAPAQGVSSTA